MFAEESPTPEDVYHWTAAEGSSYYAVLGATFTSHTDNDELRFTPPTTTEVREAFYRWVYENHPVRIGKADNDAVMRHWRCGMEAFGCLTNTTLRKRYEDFVLVSADGRADHDAHMAFLDGEFRVPYPAVCPDWIELIVSDIVDQLTPADPRNPRDWGWRHEGIGKQLENAQIPKVIPGARLTAIPLLDLGQIISDVRLSIDDFAPLRPYHITWEWVRQAKVSKGVVTKGRAVPASDSQRQRWPDGKERAPHATIELALDVWLAENDAGRWKLIAHELRHFAAKGLGERDKMRLAGVGHSVETWPEEMRDTGIINKNTARLIVEALKRPGLKAELAAWGEQLPDQVSLV